MNTTDNPGPEHRATQDRIEGAYQLNAESWGHCDNLWVFGEFFADEDYCPSPPPDRKFRLLLVAAVRAVWEHLIDSRSREAVEAAERYAESQEAGVLTAAYPGAEQAYSEVGEPWNANDKMKCLAKLSAHVAWETLDPELNDDRGLPPWVDTLCNLLSRCPFHKFAASGFGDRL